MFLSGGRPQIVVTNIDPAADLPVRIIGDANPAGFGEAFKPHRGVDAFAENIVFIDDDIADMQADPELDPQIRRDFSVLRGDPALELDCAARGIDRAGEFEQHAVAGGLDDAPAMRGDGRIDEVLAQGLQPGPHALGVGSHQAAIVGDIRRHYRRQSSFEAIVSQTVSQDPDAPAGLLENAG